MVGTHQPRRFGKSTLRSLNRPFVSGSMQKLHQNVSCVVFCVVKSSLTDYDSLTAL